MIINTPSGYVVHLKDELSFGEDREIQKKLIATVKMKPGTKAEDIEINGTIAYELEEMACRYLVTKVVINGQESTSNLYELILSWGKEDGAAVFKAVNEITKEKQKPEAEKK